MIVVTEAAHRRDGLVEVGKALGDPIHPVELHGTAGQALCSSPSERQHGPGMSSLERLGAAGGRRLRPAVVAQGPEDLEASRRIRRRIRQHQRLRLQLGQCPACVGRAGVEKVGRVVHRKRAPHGTEHLEVPLELRSEELVAPLHGRLQ